MEGEKKVLYATDRNRTVQNPNLKLNFFPIYCKSKFAKQKSMTVKKTVLYRLMIPFVHLVTCRCRLIRKVVSHSRYVQYDTYVQYSKYVISSDEA